MMDATTANNLALIDRIATVLLDMFWMTEPHNGEYMWSTTERGKPFMILSYGGQPGSLILEPGDNCWVVLRIPSERILATAATPHDALVAAAAQLSQDLNARLAELMGLIDPNHEIQDAILRRGIIDWPPVDSE